MSRLLAAAWGTDDDAHAHVRPAVPDMEVDIMTSVEERAADTSEGRAQVEAQVKRGWLVTFT